MTRTPPETNTDTVGRAGEPASVLTPGCSPLEAVETTLTLLATGPRPLVFDASGLAPDGFLGLPDRAIPVTELRTLLLDRSLPRPASDAVWRELVRLARTGDPAWTVACAGIALPALRRIAAGLTRGFAGDRDDIDAEVLAGFLAALEVIDLSWTRIAFRLVSRARRAGIRARRANRPLGQPLPDTDQAAPARRPAGHPDLVLASAVQHGVITAAEAELIGATRLGGVNVRSYAAATGIGYKLLLQRRRRAERRLVASITSGDLPEPAATEVRTGRPPSVRDQGHTTGEPAAGTAAEATAGARRRAA